MTCAIVPSVQIGTGTLELPSKSEFHQFILTFRHSTHSTQNSTRSSPTATCANTRTVSPSHCPSALLWWCETPKMCSHPVLKLQPSPQHHHVSVEQERVTQPGCFLQLHTKQGCAGHSHYKHVAWKALLLFHDHYEEFFKLLCVSQLDFIPYELSQTDTYAPPPLEAMTSPLQEGMGLPSSWNANF